MSCTSHILKVSICLTENIVHHHYKENLLTLPREIITAHSTRKYKYVHSLGEVRVLLDRHWIVCCTNLSVFQTKVVRPMC